MTSAPRMDRQRMSALRQAGVAVVGLGDLGARAVDASRGGGGGASGRWRATRPGRGVGRQAAGAALPYGACLPLQVPLVRDRVRALFRAASRLLAGRETHPMTAAATAATVLALLGDEPRR